MTSLPPRETIDLIADLLYDAGALSPGREAWVGFYMGRSFDQQYLSRLLAPLAAARSAR